MPRLRGGSPDLRRDNTQDTELSPSRARRGSAVAARGYGVPASGRRGLGAQPHPGNAARGEGVPASGRRGFGAQPHPDKDVAAVRRRLQTYADRGVFRGYAERPPRAGRHYFRFLWLAPEPFSLTYEPASGTLTFTNVLPHVRARSELAAELRRFIEGRSAPALPAHRRIDRRRARPGCSNHRGTLQVQVVAKPGHHAYGVTKSVNLVHEIFLHLHSYFPEYLWEHYDVAQD